MDNQAIFYPKFFQGHLQKKHAGKLTELIFFSQLLSARAKLKFKYKQKLNLQSQPSLK